MHILILHCELLQLTQISGAGKSVVRCFTLTLGCPLWRGRRPLVVLVQEPILLRIVQWVDHFGHQFKLFSDLEHGAGVLVPTAVVCSGEDCEKLATREPLEPIHHALVSSQNKLASVCVEEVLDTVRAKFDDVSCAVGVTNEVWLDSQVLITVGRVRPKDVDNKLLLWG